MKRFLLLVGVVVLLGLSGYLGILQSAYNSIYQVMDLETVLLLLVVLAGLVVWAAVFVIITYIFAKYDFCFTFVREGTAVGIKLGESFNHFLMAYRGHYLNDPRMSWFDNTKPAWEVLPSSNPNERRFPYAKFSPWRLPARFGIYWYGLWPLYDIDSYEFKWTEESFNQKGEREPRFRDEKTNFIYVSLFAYWLKLNGAEDRKNIPVDLDYLLSVRINNPYIARYQVVDWLSITSADANNAAKIWVGSHTFEEIVQEKTTTGPSGFTACIGGLNSDLPTFSASVGAPKALGVTIVASSLQGVQVGGRNQEAIVGATTAATIAEREADAVRARAQGEADAIRIVAEEEAKRITTVASAAKDQGETGLVLLQTDAIRAAAKSPGTTVVWANNPIAAAAAKLFNSDPTKPN